MNGLIVYNDDIDNAPYITDLKSQLYDLALTNLRAAGVMDGAYTGPEIYAMSRFEMLKLMSEHDLAGVVVRGQLLKEIEEKELHLSLPAKYDDAKQAVEVETKMSKGQQSVTNSLYRIVFPYVQQKLGMSIPEFWAEIGKSNAAEMVPYLVATITGKPSGSERVNKLLDKLEEDIEVDDDADEEEIIQAKVEEIIDRGKLVNKEWRQQMGIDSTPNIEGLVLRRNGSRFFIAELTEDQLTMLMRIAGNHMDVAYLDLKVDKPMSIPTVKKLLEG